MPVSASYFMLCSSMAAIGGILGASRLLAVNQSSGSGDTLLLAIAAPVIAGVSPVWRAWQCLGRAALRALIGSISNGMDYSRSSRRRSSSSPARSCWPPW